MLVPTDDRKWTSKADCREESCEVTHELELRVRELNCLFGISKLVERSEGDLDAILKGTAEALPSSWEHAAIACARIVLDGQEYATANFDVSSCGQSVEFSVDGVRAGLVEVRYLDKHTSPDANDFLPSEYELLHAVAERLGHVVERIRAQGMLRQRDQELRDHLAHITRVVVLGEMASMIAHEINQPLTAIANYAHACNRRIESKSIGSSDTQDVLLKIGKEAIRAGSIIHGLKDLVRKRETKHEESELRALILDIEPLLQIDARLNDVRLRLEIAHSLPTVLVDRVQLQQVIVNLVRNAVDSMAHTPSDYREVVLRTLATADGDVKVRVSDHGCGIPAGNSERVYETYFSTKESGMGMGLSVSQAIVAAHGGTLEFCQNPGGGTIFHFTIPPATGGEHVA